MKILKFSFQFECCSEQQQSLESKFCKFLNVLLEAFRRLTTPNVSDGNGKNLPRAAPQTIIFWGKYLKVWSKKKLFLNAPFAASFSFFKWAIPGLFLFIFGLFKLTLQLLQQSNVSILFPNYYVQGIGYKLLVIAFHLLDTRYWITRYKVLNN